MKNSRIILTQLQVSKVYELAHREQLRWEATLEILVASKTRPLWEDENKCLPVFLQKTNQDILKHIPQCEQNAKRYRDIANAFFDLKEIVEKS